MPESNKPLVLDGRESITTTTWTELLKYSTDPRRKAYIRDITININSVAFTSHIRVILNGEPILRDFIPVNVTTTLAFGGDLVLNEKERDPLKILVKSDGTNTLNATAVVTGVIEEI